MPRVGRGKWPASAGEQKGKGPWQKKGDSGNGSVGEVMSQCGRYGFSAISVLTLGEGEAAAADMIRRAAWLAVPLMVKRQWRVGRLSEFRPKGGLLGLNVNMGAHIKIRLRQSSSPSSFLPFIDILGTVLHELVHNNVGPHNASFYATLDQLWEEVWEVPGYDSIVNGAAPPPRGSNGSAVAGVFQGRGEKLGGKRRHGNLREAMAGAASRRRDRGGGSIVLGGRKDPNLTAAQAAAAAAMRRAKDDEWCGQEEEDAASSSHLTAAPLQPLGNGASEKTRNQKTGQKRASSTPIIEIIDLT